MDTRKACCFTGRVELCSGWEIRPLAWRRDDGLFVPECRARRHEAGCSASRVLTLASACTTREAAIEAALDAGRALVGSPA